MLRTAPLRLLDNSDLPAALELLGRDRVANCFVSSRLEVAGLDPWRLGAEVWGYVEDGELAAMCYAGANLVPVGAGEPAIRAFADRARRQGRRCSSIVGPAQMVLATSAPAALPGDPRVRRVRPDELDIILPACVAMFTEEVGVSPTSGDGGTLYRARVAELLEEGRSYARIEDGRVLFKAEIGSVARGVCQVQGVWVDPEFRGRGLSINGMATVVDEALRTTAPVVSLYVNDYNVAARRAYERVGFREAGAFSSVLF